MNKKLFSLLLEERETVTILDDIRNKIKKLREKCPHEWGSSVKKCSKCELDIPIDQQKCNHNWVDVNPNRSPLCYDRECTICGYFESWSS